MTPSTLRSSNMTIVWFVCALLMCRIAMTQGTTWAHFSVLPGNSVSTTNVIQCARNYKSSPFGAVRIRDDGSDCEGLPATWEQSPTYDSGFVYLRMASTVTTMIPPSRILKTPTELPIPGILHENSKIELVISSPDFSRSLAIALKEKIDIDYVMKVVLKGGEDPLVSHTVDGRNALTMHAPFPFASGNPAYTIAFAVKAGYIEASVDNAPWFNFTTAGKLSPSTADIVWLKTGFAQRKFYVDQFTFYSS